MIGNIDGIVKKNPVVFQECCMFAVERDDGVYLIISTGRQASKDNIFVTKGQEISITGTVLEDENIKGVLLAEQEKIILKRSE